MSNHELLDKLDGIQHEGKMELLYPEAMSKLHRSVGHTPIVDHSPHHYKRKVKKNMDRRGRFRTQPVTFMEIQEVDEDNIDYSALNDHWGRRSSRSGNETPANNASNSSEQVDRSLTDCSEVEGGGDGDDDRLSLHQRAAARIAADVKSREGKGENNISQVPEKRPEKSESLSEEEDQVGQLLSPQVHAIHNQAKTLLLRAMANAPLEFPKGFSVKPRPSI